MKNVYKLNNDVVRSNIYNGKLDHIEIQKSDDVGCILNYLVDQGVLNSLEYVKTLDPQDIPFNSFLLLLLSQTMKNKYKHKQKPYVIQDCSLLNHIGFNVFCDTLEDVKRFQEDMMTYYKVNWVDYYSRNIKRIMSKFEYSSKVHRLDFALSNEIIVLYSHSMCIYVEKIWIIDEKRELNELLSEVIDMLRKGDILIDQTGMLSKNTIDILKTKHTISVYQEAKKYTNTYNMAISIANTKDHWEPYKDEKHVDTMIAYVENVGEFYDSIDDNSDIILNACVIWSEKSQDYFVIVTSDVSTSARYMVEILESEKCSSIPIEKYIQEQDNVLTREIHSDFYHFRYISMLLGYIFYNIYEQYHCDKKEVEFTVNTPIYIVYSGKHFGVYSSIDFFEIYAECDLEVKSYLSTV